MIVFPNAGKPELLAPAGNFEKLRTAVHFGADAVYLGGKLFSLRNYSGNFSDEEMSAAVEFARNKGVRTYVAVNVYPRTQEEPEIERHLKFLGKIRPDAVIIADPGILSMARCIIPEIPIHLSTQANNTSAAAVRFWENNGISRVNLARELSMEEIAEIASAVNVEVETFVHGAMCVSYSGRCLLSSYMAQRDGNRGMCSHPCRWQYRLVEELRPGKYMPVGEDDRGTYIFNSTDLCMIQHIPELIQAGISSFKIEGRMKGIHYVASTVRVYRAAIDTYMEAPGEYQIRREWVEELARVNTRGYSTGFYFNDPDEVLPVFTGRKLESEFRFAGKILKADVVDKIKVEVRNRFDIGDTVEILRRKGPVVKETIQSITDSEGLSCDRARSGTIVMIGLKADCEENDLIRVFKTASESL